MGIKETKETLKTLERKCISLYAVMTENRDGTWSAPRSYMDSVRNASIKFIGDYLLLTEGSEEIAKIYSQLQRKYDRVLPPLDELGL